MIFGVSTVSCPTRGFSALSVNTPSSDELMMPAAANADVCGLRHGGRGQWSGIAASDHSDEYGYFRRHKPPLKSGEFDENRLNREISIVLTSNHDDVYSFVEHHQSEAAWPWRKATRKAARRRTPSRPLRNTSTRRTTSPSRLAARTALVSVDFMISLFYLFRIYFVLDACKLLLTCFSTPLSPSHRFSCFLSRSPSPI